MTNHDVREHGPDGANMDPAFVPPLLPPPPRATTEAPAPMPEQMFVGRKTKGRKNPGHLQRQPALEARRRRPRPEPERRGRRCSNSHLRQAPAPNLAPGLGDSYGWAVAPLQMLQRTAGRIALAVTGGGAARRLPRL